MFECLLLVTTIFIVKSVLKESVSDWQLQAFLTNSLPMPIPQETPIIPIPDTDSD